MSYKHSILADNPISFYLLDEVPSSTFLSYTQILNEYATYQELLDSFATYNQLSGLPIIDYSGNGHDGTALSASTKEVIPLVSTSIRGTEVLADTQINLRFHNIANKYYPKDSFTLEVWAKPNSLRQEYLNILGDPQNSIGIFYQNGDIVFRIYDHEVRSKISYNKAHYIVAIYTKTSMSLYVDSVFAASLSLSNFSFTNESSAFSIGPANQYEYFIVDSAAAYRYPLTEKQINSHYTAGLNKIKYKEIISQKNSKSFSLYSSKINPRLAYNYPSITPWTDVIEDNNVISENQKEIRFEKTTTAATKEISFIDSFYIEDSYGITSSQISYDSDVENIVVEFSLDGVSGWQVAKNNFPIPFFNKNDSVTSGPLFMRVTMSSSDTSKDLPVLKSIELLFYSKKDFYGDNSNLKIYSSYDYGLDKYNNPILSHDYFNGLRMYNGHGFNLQLPALSNAVEVIFSPVGEGNVLFANGDAFYKWDISGAISQSGIDSIYINGIDRSSQTNIFPYLTNMSPHHIVLNLSDAASGIASFNSSVDGLESGGSNTYSNIAIYESQLSPAEIEENYKLYTDRILYSISDTSLTLNESVQGSDNTGYFINELVWSSSSI
jgi:hypothetical protein